MPKVSQEYIINKKKLITGAAYELCLEKNACTVTMQDIINRTGLSQGGIYRFYHDIDEIFSDMFVQLRSKINLRERVDEIYSHADEMTTAELVYKLFDLLGEYMEEELMGVAKIEFELSVLAINAPERIDKIIGDKKEIGDKLYITRRGMEFFEQKLKEGQIKSKIGPTELMAYITSVYSGIEMNCIVYNCYRKGYMAEAYQPRKLFRILAESINQMLGLE